MLARIVSEILDSNQTVWEEVQKLLAHPLAEIIYVYGNHDGLIQHYPGVQEHIRKLIGRSANAQARLHFVESYTSPELGLHVEHGHLLDPFNRPEHHHPPLGDVINVLIVNRFVERALSRLTAHGYSERLIEKMHTRLHDIEYLRPLSLLPVWIQNTANHYLTHPENVGKTKE